MLEVWGRKTSSNVQALMWCIGELELPYQRYDVRHKYGGTDSDEFYRLNPNRTIPVIRDNGGRLSGRQAQSCDIWPVVTGAIPSGQKIYWKERMLIAGLNGQKSVLQ
jgi:hypothetical protein